jgi:hypothetical protein
MSPALLRKALSLLLVCSQADACKHACMRARQGKARLGTIVHLKTAAALALTAVKSEDQRELAKIVDSARTSFNDAPRMTWGGARVPSPLQPSHPAHRATGASQDGSAGRLCCDAPRMTWGAARSLSHYISGAFNDKAGVIGFLHGLSHAVHRGMGLSLRMGLLGKTSRVECTLSSGPPCCMPMHALVQLPAHGSLHG